MCASLETQRESGCSLTAWLTVFVSYCLSSLIIFISISDVSLPSDKQYYVPRCVDCTSLLNEWVYGGSTERLMAAGPRDLPELVRRFTQDVYMYVYIQPDYGMYTDIGKMNNFD